MAPPQTLTSKLKVHLKMAIQRLRMLQQKNTAISKQQRRAMAELLTASKLESARIRVEGIIRSDILTELHEYLELYCELLLARIAILDQIPTIGATVSLSEKREKDKAKGKEVVEEDNEIDSGLEEAVRAIVFSAPKIDVKELLFARSLLSEKFGKDFTSECQAGTKVPERVLKRLKVETPKVELVDAYLREIARTYGVKFPGEKSPHEAEDEEFQDSNDEIEQDGNGSGNGDGDGDGGLKEPPLHAEELVTATPPRDSVGEKSSIQVVPPSPSTENVSPFVKLPGGDEKGIRPPALRKPSGGGTSSSAANKSKSKDKSKDEGGPGGKVPDFDDLSKRFAALKKA